MELALGVEPNANSNKVHGSVRVGSPSTGSKRHQAERHGRYIFCETSLVTSELRNFCLCLSVLPF